MHIVDILDKGKADADMPWEAFTYEASPLPTTDEPLSF